MKKTLLKDTDGKISSKRVNAVWLIGLGSLMAVIAYSIALFKPLGDPSFIKDVIGLFLLFGSGISVATVAEHFVGRRKRV